MIRTVHAGALEVAYLEHGPTEGPPVILLHGFPYDAHAYAEVAPVLAATGRRVIVPWLRGYGGTRLLGAAMRSGQQAALAHDLLALLDALAIPRAVLAGYDWGGRAACILAALWPERVAGLVSANGYNIQDIAAAARPLPPHAEQRLWYQYYLHGERGAAGLAADRRGFCSLLWGMWSPEWRFDAATFDRSAASFENPDFVPVVVHSYRHRFGLVPGDPACADTERRLAAQPPIPVPTITLDGAADGVAGPPRSAAHHASLFPRHLGHRVLPGIGHNIPQEAPQDFAEAILALP